MRLEQVVYMSFANDVSYLIDDTIIVLAEHQSTINSNLPLRCLEYVTRLYEHIQSPRDRYSRTLKKIPIPEFYVFYNWKEDIEINQTLKLSDQVKMAHLNMQLFLLKFFKLYAIVIKKYTEKVTICLTSITSTGGGH